MKEKRKKRFFYLTIVLGVETDHPFGSLQIQSSLVKPIYQFCKPIHKELKKKIRKVKKNYFLALKVLKEKTRWVIKIVLVLKRIMKKLEKVNSISSFELRKVKVKV